MASRLLEELSRPIVQAPMGGGPSTPELAAAVSGAGGLGFLAAAYKSASALLADIAATRELTDRFGVNVFVPGPATEPSSLAGYVEGLGGDAERYGVAVGKPRHSDDDWGAKLEVLLADPPPLVSFTFGVPPSDVAEAFQSKGSEVWVTVTTPEEARAAQRGGADALVAQGAEAGAHQGSFDDSREGDPYGLLALLQLLGAATDLPLVASGGIATGAAVAAVLCAGASAAQLGTAFLPCPEAGTAEVHREALGREVPTEMTRAFTGRSARGIVNRFMREHPDAPRGYPELHYATAPIRAAARERGDADAVNLWAGQSHALSRPLPAAELVEEIDAEARAALLRAGGLYGSA
jgi:nitronate monooxygenase